MDIIEFFQHSVGKWFSQRTSQDLASEQSTAGTSDLWIETVSPSDPEVIKLCEQYRIDPSSALCGARVRWESKPNKINEPTQSGSTFLVPIGEGDRPTEGKLLHKPSAADPAPVLSRYIIGTDDALTLITESETRQIIERIWFASENLRMRTSIVKQPDGFSVASFYSEIRMGGTQPPAKTDTRAQSAS